jgi:1,4-dihydroxy-6-naphthoate synthase
MMRALLEQLIDTGPYQFEIDTQPTDSLNQLALDDGPDVLALSVAHYPYVAANYQLLPHGGSMGEGYGPVVISNVPMEIAQLQGKRIAVPGLTTSACATLRMMMDFQPEVVSISPYTRVFEILKSGDVDAGLIIHEGRLTFSELGFHKVIDLGEWWAEETDGLPLPLGANAIKRSLGETTIIEVSELLRQSIAHGLAHRDEAISWLLSHGGPLNTVQKTSDYLNMYANQRTLNYGPKGRLAIQQFLNRAATLDLVPQVDVDYSP